MNESSGGRSGRPTRNTIKVLNRRLPMPATRAGRMTLGWGLVIGGALGFLPILGFWMLPLGFLVLAQDVPRFRRWRRNIIVRWGRRGKNPSDGESSGRDRKRDSHGVQNDA